jgi:hypothetical protein
MFRPHRQVWALMFVVILGTLITACSLSASKPTIVIIDPPSGSQFREGEEIAIRSTSTDEKGVVRVELIVDNVIIRADAAPVPQGQTTFNLSQTWQATSGTHTIFVRAYNTSGAVSDPVAISINVLPQNAQGSTPVPTIAASSSSRSSSVASSSSSTSAASSSSASSIPASSSSSAAACTNNAAFIVDVTVPDGTSFNASQPFSKVWRVSNTGTCTWGVGYQFVFVAGEAMATTTVYPVPQTAPGATIDLPVAMTAPASAGPHAGQWRLRASNGALFGPTLTAKINTLAVSSSSSSSASTGCSGTPNIASFTASATSVAPGTAVTLNWGLVSNADSAEIDQGIGGIETPGSRTVNPASTTTYTLTARCGVNAITRQVTITVVPPAPAQVAPADGTVWRVFPRNGTLSWNVVTFPGGVTYNVEIQIDRGAGWETHTDTGGIAGTTYNFTFSGDNPGRWRVWATSPTAGAGAKSPWRSFSFNTGASQYSGNWFNDDAGTNGVTKIFITNSGQTLNVHPFGKCTPTDCDWGTKSQTFNGEPFIISGFPSGGAHQLTITLNNAQGTSLKVIDAGGSGTFTYTFHK